MSDGRDVPRAVIEGLKASDFLEGCRGGSDQSDGAIFGLNKQRVLPEQHVTVSIATAFPEPFAGGGIDAGQDAVIKSIDVAAECDGFVEFEFQAAGGRPDFCWLLVVQACGIQQYAAGVVAAAEKQGVVKANRLSHVDFVLVGPRVEPE